MTPLSRTAVAMQRRRPIARLKPRTALRSYVIYAFILLTGIATSFSVHVVGDMPVGEMVLVCALPVLLFFNARKALRSDLMPVYVMMFLWLLGQVIADAYNQINMIDRMRGMALIVFFGLDLLGMSLLVADDERRKLVFIVGVTIGALVSVKLQPSAAAADYPWKFGYAWGAMQFALLVSCFFYGHRRYVLAALPVLAVCAINLVENFRSPVLDLLVMLVLVFPVIPDRIGAVRILPRQGSFARVFVLVIFVMAAGAIAAALVQYVTRAGYLSEENQEKNQAQTHSGGLLFGGRPEFVVGLHAALDSPIIGHGSWPQDRKYTEMFSDMEATYGNSDTAKELASSEGALIPTHSHLVGAWVFAGILGLIFWLYILFVVLRSIVRISVLRPALAPFYCWSMIGTFWDIFFSPFAFTRRIGEAFLLVVMMDLLKQKIVVAPQQWIRLRGPLRMHMQGRTLPRTRIAGG